MPDRHGIPDPAGSGGSGVGSVADETARLVDALLGPTSRPEPPPAGASAETAPGEGCPRCGHVDLGEGRTHPPADLCHLCPVCQVLRVVRSVRPETLDRLADFAGAVTESLRDAAAERRRTTGAAGDPAGDPAAAGHGDGARPARPQVQDILVTDDDGGADASVPLHRAAPTTEDLEDVP